MRGRAAILALAAAAALAPAVAPAWEATTTSAGIVERAALSSGLHRKLGEQLGASEGLYSRLRIPRADAAQLFQVLDKLNPVHGYVPGPKGRQLALGWLAAGAAIADTPPEFAANHFFDPKSGRGLHAEPTLRQRLTSKLVRESLVHGGVAAPDWVAAGNNPFSLAGFHDQYRKAVRSRTPAERERHTAGALLAAGSMLHVLVDLATPSHVRNDLASHLKKLSDDDTDVGSRFERVAALAFGRLGVPRAAEVPRLATLRDYFTSLARRIEPSYFSPGTLPRTVRVEPGATSAEVTQQVVRSLRRPLPTISTIDLGAARSPDGGRLENAQGVCLARYTLREDHLRWDIPDACAVEQIAAILPVAAAYGAGALDYLFRGALTVEPAGDQLAIKPTGAALGAGRLTVFWDDELGVRTELTAVKNLEGAADQATLARVAPPPAKAKKIAVLFEGVDAAGEPISAAAVLPWPLKKRGGSKKPAETKKPEAKPAEPAKPEGGEPEEPVKPEGAKPEKPAKPEGAAKPEKPAKPATP